MGSVAASLAIFLVSFCWATSGWATTARGSEARLTESPVGCYQKQVFPCQLQVRGGTLAIEQDTLSLQLGKETAVSLPRAGHLQILHGSVWVRRSQDLRVHFSSVLEVAISGEWFFHRENTSQMLARNLGGEIQFHSEKVFEHEALPVGFQNWFGAVDATGEVSRGVIRPIDMLDFLKAWVPVAGLASAESRERVAAYRQAWREGLELASELYTQIVSRRLASVEDQELRRKRAAQAAAAEQARLRRMFREKNGLSAEGT